MSFQYLQPENITDPAITHLEDLRYHFAKGISANIYAKGDKCTGAVCGHVGDHYDMQMPFKGSRCGKELGWAQWQQAAQGHEARRVRTGRQMGKKSSRCAGCPCQGSR
jgi:hypothetical protein